MEKKYTREKFNFGTADIKRQRLKKNIEGIESMKHNIESIEANDDSIRDVLARIIGINETLELILMLEYENCGDISTYKLVPTGDPEKIVREILNAEIALSMSDKVSKETVDIAKAYMDTITRTLLFVLRKYEHTQEEIEEELKELIKTLSGERIHVLSMKTYLAKKLPFRVNFLRNQYGMNSREISKIIIKSREQTRRYQNELDKNQNSIYNEKYIKVSQIMEEQHRELLKRQNNKIFVRPKNRSQTYNVEDLNKKPKEKGKLMKIKIDDITNFEQ